MQHQLISEIATETSARLTGRFLGKILQLSPFSFVLDFGLRGAFLFISVDPSSPRFYIIERRIRELEKLSTQFSPFGQLMRARVGGGQVVGVEQDPGERIVRLTIRAADDAGAGETRRLLIQLTGRAANLFLLDEQNRIIASLRPPKGEGQSPGDLYQRPAAAETRQREAAPDNVAGSPSAFADAYFTKLDAASAFLSRATSVRAALHKWIVRQQKLKTNLQNDLASHGDPGEHKRRGDLLLANASTALRDGSKVRLTDYYAEGTPEIELEVDEHSSLQDEAARQYRQYAKAKRAREEIADRLTKLVQEIAQLEKREQELDRIIRDRDETALAGFDDSFPRTRRPGSRSAEPERIPGVRRYLSSDGYEILVGRAARDNDNLTFRLAKPHDLWLHAGDYPGSHVIVRNPTRKPIPQRTILEAARLAGHFSQASENSKVVVHYAERKFLSKPKGAAPGLVRMSSFRSITIEPRESVGRL